LRSYLGKDVTGSLRSFSQDKGGTLFMGLVASLTALFYRYTGREDILFGSPIAGRDHVDLSDQIGFYVNTLVLRNGVSGRDSFSDLYDRVKASTLEAYTHQRYPFDRLVEELDLH
uniref:condensation domain-containing protein n=1 Tax=Aquimarina algiphila TaxID=2047982 RepID=UPI00232D05B8